MLRLEQVSKRFGSVVAVDQVDLAVVRGELLALLGPSGCGKTTVLRLIAGFERPDKGRIWLGETDLTRTPPYRRHMGMVFQSYALFPHLTVRENIAFGLKMARVPSNEVNARVREMLALIRMSDAAERYPHQLSGGQQQRVALARALAPQPQALLLDEPLSALDARIRAELRAEIRAIQQQLGITTIYVTHDQEEALALADRVAVMNNGRIEQVGTPNEIYHHPRTAFVASFVGALNVLYGTVCDQNAILVEGCPIRVAQPLDAPIGQMLKIGVRPERIRLHEADGDFNRLSATVESVTMLGALVRIQTKFGASRLSVDCLNAPDQPLPTPGSTVTLHLPAQACYPIP
ncbi:MAG: ABC transporter ATP-binding protein [Thermoflexales bacterium]|nr:ABC transporter ATP-binding protein [Thermoflexales bacterium]